YVPPRVVHQTIVTGEEPLTYLLFNAFLDASKEGHASFAEHIEQVKLLRKQQAETQKADVAGSSASLFSDRPGKHVPEADGGPRSGSGALLLDRSETCRSEVARLVCLAGGHVEAVTDPVAERTLYVLKGGGQLALGDETAELHPGDVAFIPWHTPHRLIATQSDLVCLCFSTRVADAVAV
ncbi:MAG: cupin domain-containing protein, partial [Verrucomicrobiales bacterium]|nr:cupin domain-containing protein [Verrucomicrobiales bacterium]